MPCLSLSRQPPGWLWQHSSSRGWGPRQTGRLAGPGPPTGPLAPAQHPCLPAETCLWAFPKASACRGDPAGAMQLCKGHPFIFHSLNHMADFLCSFWAQVSQATIPPDLFAFEDCLHSPPPLKLINKFSRVGNTLEQIGDCCCGLEGTDLDA